jgi:deazaflavin-dependent oxidoreductase (nitroreductase family)
VGVDEFRSALQGTREIELTVVGRRSGRESSRPVWFVQDGATLYLLPVTGSDSNWYRNLVKAPEIGVTAGGAELRTHARPIDDPDQVRDVVERFRSRYGAEQVETYYPKRDVAVEVPLG